MAISLNIGVIVAGMQISESVFGLTNDNPEITTPVYKQYRHTQYVGGIPSTPTISVSFPPTDDKFQYVILQQQFGNNVLICLAEVKVFLRGIADIITKIQRGENLHAA